MGHKYRYKICCRCELIFIKSNFYSTNLPEFSRGFFLKVDRCEIVYIIKLDFPGAFHTASHGRLIHTAAGEAEKGPFSNGERSWLDDRGQIRMRKGYGPGEKKGLMIGEPQGLVLEIDTFSLSM